MTVDMRPLHEINRDGHAALVRELGVVGALRFLSQFTTGRGDYTAERAEFLGDESFKELLDEIENESGHSAAGAGTGGRHVPE